MTPARRRLIDAVLTALCSAALGVGLFLYMSEVMK